VAKKIPCLDLHGVYHDEADFIIEKFISDNFQKLPVKIITGYSDFFIDKTKEISGRHELGCYPESLTNFGCYIIFRSKWKFFLDSDKE
jgi:hypothetical protein